MPSNFTIVKKGYDPTEVDAYINNLESVVNSYKENDASIKNAILSAQVAGDAIASEAKSKAERIISGSVSIVSEITELIAGKRKLIDNFKADYNELIKKYVNTANDVDFDAIYAKIESLERYYDEILKKTDGDEDTKESQDS